MDTTRRVPEQWQDLGIDERHYRQNVLIGQWAAVWACEQRGDAWAHDIVRAHRVVAYRTPGDPFENNGGARRSVEAWLPDRDDAAAFYARRNPEKPVARAELGWWLPEFFLGYRQELIRRVVEAATVNGRRGLA